MTIVLFILIVIISIILGLIILIQNPKGGGLSGTLAGFNNQFMGVKQTTDVLEKGTWIFASALGMLCVISVLFISTTGGKGNNSLQDINTSTVPSQQAPANSQQQAAPDNFQLPADSNNK